jgi:hypothetical protein
MTQIATAPKVPWLISFQQKDLLTACWGSEKEANLLYHFLNKASWEAKNQGLESCKVIPFKEEHDKILKLVPMAEGTLIKYLKRFNLAGYVSSSRYGNNFTVNVEAIRAAFADPPEKPLSAPRGRPKGFKVSRIKKTENTETLENNTGTSRINEEKSEVSRINEHEEVSRLNEKVLNLELEVLNLKEKVLILELYVLNLKLSETRESTPEAAAGTKVSLQNDLEMIQTDSEMEGTYQRAGESENAAASGYAIATPTHAHSSSQDDPTLENTDYQPEPAIPGHDPHAPHLAENCKNWRLLFGGLEVATCQQYQAAIDTQREQRAASQAYESDNQSRIASDTPTTQGEQNGPDGHSDSVSGDHSGRNHRNGLDDLQPAAGRSRGATPTQQQPTTRETAAHSAGHTAASTGTARTVAAGAGLGNDLAAAHPSTSPAGNHRDVGGEQAGAALGAKMDVGGQAAGDYEKPEQATLTAGATPTRAVYEPRKAARSRSSKGNENRTYWTLEGSSFRGWYEEIFGIQLDETAANARACNVLGKRASVTYDNVVLVKAEIDVNKWVKTNNVAVTPQDLANDNSNLRWEKWLQAAQNRNRKPVASVPKPATPAEIEENPYSLAAQLARNPLPTLGATV